LLRLVKKDKKDKPAPPTDEELAEKHAEKLKKWQEKDQEDFDKNFAGHQQRCDRRRPLWNKRIDAIMAEEAQEVARAKAAGESQLPVLRTREQITARLAQNAKDDVEELDREIFSLVTRTGMLLSATTLLFAVFALRSTSSKSGWATAGTVTLAIALLIAAVAFVTALFPFRPPLYRAWKIPYEPRAFKTLLMHDDFNTWVWYNWLGDRRTPVAQAYKKAHALAVPLLIAAAILTVPGLGLSLIFR
jgi:hypothetical protein